MNIYIHIHIGLSALCKRTGGELMRSRDSKEAISLMRAFLHRVGSEQGVYMLYICMYVLYIYIYVCIWYIYTSPS
jgi:hypothetical protein